MAESLPFVSRDLPVRGCTLRCWETGEHGPSVLFLHGFLDTGRSFGRTLEALGPGVRSHCLDWRGHGGSRPIPEGMSFHQLDHLKDLAQVVDAVRPELIVAHSMGATIAYLYAASAPGKVPAYLLLDAVGGFASTPADQADALQKLLVAEAKPKPGFRAFPDAEAAVARVRHNNPGLSEEGARWMVRHATEADADGQLQFSFDPRLRGPNPMRYSEAIWRELAGRIQDRVHVLLGERGLIQKAPVLRDRAEAIPGAQLSIAPEAGHHLHLDAPGVVAEAIRALI